MRTKPGSIVSKFTPHSSVSHRSLMVYRNVIQSILIKGLGILVGFLTIPLTLDCISVSDFGIWMTITFLTSWFSLVDVSFGNGLRNNLVSLLTAGNMELARKYVSTLYFLSAILAFVLIILIMAVGHYLEWTNLLNLQSSNAEQVNDIITYTLICFCLQLVLKPINAILLADHKAALVGWIVLVMNLLIIGVIYLVTLRADKSLLIIAHIYNLVPLAVLGLVSIYFFTGIYAQIAPKISYIDLSVSRGLFNAGGQFFILQLISVVVFTSGGLFISYFLGSDSVTPYSIANKYFSVITVLYGIIITPYWSAFTDAYVKQDIVWIKHTLRQLNRISLGMAFMAGLLFVLTNTVIKLWIGSRVTISTELSVSLLLYVISFVYLSNYNSFVNGTGQITSLVYASIVGLILYIILTTALFRWVKAGPASVVIAGTAWNSSLLLICWMQYRKIIHRMAFVANENG